MENKFENFKKNNLELLEKFIKEHKTIVEISNIFSISRNTLRHYLELLNIEYHGVYTNYEIEDYLSNKIPINAPILRKKLIKCGLKEEKCEMCGMSEWMGYKIPLELHHKNGDHHDNRLENLEVLCSNCHSIKHNYSQHKKKCKNCGKEFATNFNQQKFCSKECKENFKKAKFQKKCENCGKFFLTNRSNQHYCCTECGHEATKILKVTKEDLIESFKIHKTYLGVSKQYGVSDKAVYKWCKKLGLPQTSKDMKMFLLALQ